MQIRSYGAKDHICAGSRLWLSSLEHFGFNTKLGTNSAPVCSISSWKEDEATLHESLPHNKTASKKTGQLPTQRVSCFLPGIKVAAVYLWGSLQGVGPTAWSGTRGRWGWLTFRWSSSPRQGSTEIQSWSYTDRPHNIEMVTKLLQLQLLFLHLQRQAADFTEAVSRGWNRIPFWTSSAELYQDLSLISFPFCSKIKTTQFLPVSIKNPLKTTMKTITFKTRLIGKALFSFNPATQELWGDKTKMQDLIGGSVLVLQTFANKSWAFWIQ